jgi:hypothetical protein
MTSFSVAMASSPIQPFSISISVSELVQPVVTFTVWRMPQLLTIQEVTLMIEQKFSAYVPPVVALESGIVVMPRGIELASAGVVLLALLGFILAMVAPGPLTGIIFPLALVAWWLLYREIKKRGL